MSGTPTGAGLQLMWTWLVWMAMQTEAKGSLTVTLGQWPEDEAS